MYIKIAMRLVLVVHICNLSFSGDRCRSSVNLSTVKAKLVRLYVEKKIKTEVLSV
jgi:hypothetical protein